MNLDLLQKTLYGILGVILTGGATVIFKLFFKNEENKTKNEINSKVDKLKESDIIPLYKKADDINHKLEIMSIQINNRLDVIERGHEHEMKNIKQTLALVEKIINNLDKFNTK